MTLMLEAYDSETSTWIDKTGSCISLRRQIRSNGLEELDGELVKDSMSVGQEIRLKENDRIIFMGVVYEVDRRHRSRDVERCGFKAYDYLIKYDRHVVYRLYQTGTKAGEIIKDLAMLEDIPINLSGVEDGDALLSPWEIDNEKALDVMKSVARGTNYWLRMKPCLSYLSFDGENDYVEVADSPTLRDWPNGITVICWAKSSTWNWNTWGMLVSKRNSFVLHPWKDSNDISFYVYGVDSGWKGARASADVDLTDWNMWFGTYDESVITVGWNGEIKKTMSFTEEIASDTGIITIGRDDEPYTERFFDGLIALIQIYNRALTNSEIRHNYLNPMNPILDGLVLWLNFHNIQDNVVPDLSDHGNDGTIHGASQGYEVYPQYANSFLLEFKPKVIT